MFASSRRAALALILVMGFMFVVACAKPKPPTVVPKDAKIVALDTETVTLELRLELTNPNGFAIDVRRISANVMVEDLVIGTIDVPHAVSLSSNVPTLVTVPLKLRWDGAAALAKIAAKGKDVPFRVDGSVGIGGERLNVDVPYSQSGVITKQQQEEAAIRSIQRQLLPMIGSPPR
jgi:LEA14-like dessication related protein